MNRKFAIGDIHGCYDKLMSLMDKISPTIDDTIIFLGDYIDRGPQTRDVIDYLIKLNEVTNCIFLTGNHEQMLLDYINDQNDDMFLYTGGYATLESYGNLNQLKEHTHMCFLNSLEWYNTDDQYIYVHAGLVPNVALHEQDHHDLIWIRANFILYPTKLTKKVIYGHTPNRSPQVAIDKIGIDTGAFMGGKLTAIQLPEETFIQS